jgi:integrase
MCRRRSAAWEAGEMRALSVEECRQFLEAARGSEWFALFALALTTGMRPSEYLALQRSDTDWQRGTVSVCRNDSGVGAGLAILRLRNTSGVAGP